MADKTVNQLNEDTSPTLDDFMLMWDTGTSATKKVTLANALLKILNSSSSGFAWSSWTPTLSGRFDDAEWTKAGKYIQIGKTVYFRLLLTATTASPMGGGSANCIFTLPVTSVSYGTANRSSIGNGFLNDDTGSSYPNIVFWSSTTTGTILYQSVSGANVILSSITSTAPFTWTSPDTVYVQGFYEVP